MDWNKLGKCQVDLIPKGLRDHPNKYNVSTQFLRQSKIFGMFSQSLKLFIYYNLHIALNISLLKFP